MTDQTFSSRQTAEIVGISYRQLDYWARTDLIRPSGTDAAGSGTSRRYTYKDLLELKVVKRLLDSGFKLESVRDVFTYMREHVDTEISSAHIVIDGSSVVLCDGDNLVDVMKHGQGVFNVVPLYGMKSEVDEKIVSLAARQETKNAATSPQSTGGPDQVAL